MLSYLTLEIKKAVSTCIERPIKMPPKAGGALAAWYIFKFVIFSVS
jgi:hypothetical protein